uniref:Uncharacterized protein n=1 Tax=Colobus angolensis palliatus TaxID=336983 RepID=A0A2K5HXA2_COLAP
MGDECSNPHLLAKPGSSPRWDHGTPREEAENESSIRVPRVLKAHLGVVRGQARRDLARVSGSADLGLQRGVLKRAARTCLSEIFGSTRASPEIPQSTDPGRAARTRTRPLSTPHSFKTGEERERRKERKKERNLKN